MTEQTDPLSDTDKQVLLEQYKLYVEMADRVSARRGQANRYYLALMSTLITVGVFLFGSDQKGLLQDYQNLFLIVLCGISAMIAVVWYNHIHLARKLNSAKFEVIHEMENRLPEQGYTKEWRAFTQKNTQLISKNEQWVPLTFLIFSLLGILALFVS